MTGVFKHVVPMAKTPDIGNNIAPTRTSALDVCHIVGEWVTVESGLIVNSFAADLTGFVMT